MRKTDLFFFLLIVYLFVSPDFSLFFVVLPANGGNPVMTVGQCCCHQEGMLRYALLPNRLRDYRL